MKKKISGFKKFFKDKIAIVAILISFVFVAIAFIPITLNSIDLSDGFANIGYGIHSILDDWFPQKEDDPVTPGGVVDSFDSSTNKTDTNKQTEAAQPTAQTTQPISNQSSAPANNTSAVISPYVPGKCTLTTIPRKTVYEYVSWLYVDETQLRWSGMDGYTNKCTPDSWGNIYGEYTTEPQDKVFYAGTTPRPTTVTGPSYTYNEAYNLAVSNCGFAGNTSAYQPCIDAYLSKYGY